jgi:hypothetical protein
LEQIGIFSGGRHTNVTPRAGVERKIAPSWERW